jgi:hypothetical protein
MENTNQQEYKIFEIKDIKIIYPPPNNWTETDLTLNI